MKWPTLKVSRWFHLALTILSGQVSVAEARRDGERGIAEATKEAEIAKKERETATRQRVAHEEAAAIMTENTQMEERARSCASLAEVQAEADRRAAVSRIEADGAAQVREEQLQRVVQEARREREQATKEADAWTDAAVERKVAVTRAEGLREAAVIAAEGDREAAIARAQGEAEAIEIVARAEAKKIEMRLLAEALGELKMLEARAAGTDKLVEACMGDAQLVQALVYAQHEFPVKIAEANASAVRDMKPQIWSMSGADDSLTKQITTLATGLTPAMDAMRRQGLIK